MTANVAEASGSGLPGLRRDGMPMPFGQLGQEMSPPVSRLPGVGGTAAAAGPGPSRVAGEHGDERDEQGASAGRRTAGIRTRPRSPAAAATGWAGSPACPWTAAA